MVQYQKIVVTGFLKHEGKVLVVRRGTHEKFLPEYYELPGGKVDFGENPIESLEREYREEVNLKVKVGKPYRIFSYESNEGKRHTVEILFLVELDDDLKNIKLGKDHDDYALIKEDEIENYKISDQIKTSIKEGFKQ